MSDKLKVGLICDIIRLKIQNVKVRKKFTNLDLRSNNTGPCSPG